MRQFRFYILIALGIVLIYVALAYRLEQDAIREQEERFNDIQALQTQSGAQDIADHYQIVVTHTESLVNLPIAAYLRAALTVEELETVFVVATPTVYLKIPVTGLYAAPDAPIAQTVDETDLGQTTQAHLQRWLTMYWDDDALRVPSGYIVTPFFADADCQFYGFLRPVFWEGERVGVLAVVIDFSSVLERYIAPLRSGDYGAAWVQAGDSLVIYDHEPDEIGRYVNDLAEPYPDLQRINQRIQTEDKGRGQYHYTVELGGAVRRKLVAWNTAYLGDQRLSVAMSAPDSEINAALDVYRQQARVLGVLLGAALIGSGGLFYVVRQRTLQRLVMARTQELQQLNDELEVRVAQRTAELAGEQARQQTMLDTMGDGLVYRDHDHVHYINQALSDLLGYSSAELTGPAERYFEQVTGSPGGYVPEQAATPDLHVWRGHVRLRRKDGTELPVGLTAAPVIGPDGQPVGYVDVMRDISQEKALQAQKDRFIAHAAHELRTPLSNLKTRVYLLQRQPGQQERHVQVLEQVITQMVDLVNDLLDVSRFERGAIELRYWPVELQQVLDETLQSQTQTAADYGVTFAPEFPSEPVTVQADHRRLKHAFTTLVLDTMHYTETGGAVRVSLASEHADGGCWAVVRIHGAGPGIAPDMLQHLFDPFFRASNGVVPGTGLSLTLAKTVIEQHGGQVDVESDPQRGIIFTVKLNQADRAPSDPPALNKT
ncbi:MAG: PAS domain-containing sensor histidine kinase [Chloroflexi bacterium]|nr:PAS domain-containing sensor histidine kinase [Chloroflexota bacterium]